MAGLTVTAAGIAMILQANVGLEAWSVLQTGLSGTLGISYGAASIIVGGMIILTVVVLKESFGFGTIADILICGPMVDVVRGLNVIPKMESLGGGLVMLLAGLEVLVPRGDDAALVDRVIFEELCLGQFLESSRKEYLRIIEELRREGAQAVI